jgi:hypothetical protein
MRAALKSAFQEAAGSEGRKRKVATRPFSIRLTRAEKEALKTAAGAKPLGTYVRLQLLGSGEPRRVQRSPRANTAVLGQILAILGKSSVCKSLAELASAARCGALILTPEIEAALVSACEDVRKVRDLLMGALGLSAGASR